MLKHPSVKHTVGKAARVLVKEERTVKKKTDIFQRIFGQKVISSRKRLLKWPEFFAINIYLQLSLNYMIIYYDMVLIHGALITVFANLLITMTMGVPLIIINILLGNYSKKAYFKVWQMVPIFSGIGWSVALYQLLQECFNVAAAGLAILYLIDVFKSNTWSDCSFSGATTDCIPADTREELVANCCTLLMEDRGNQLCSETRANFASLEYFRNYKLRMDETQNDSLWQLVNLQWVSTVGVVWLFIYMFMIQDFPRFKRFIKYMAIACIIMSLVPALMVVFTAGLYSVPKIMSNRLGNLISPKTYVDMVYIVVSHSLPGTIIFFGTNVNNNKTPPVISALLCGTSIVVMTLLLNWMSISINLVADLYRVENSNCLQIFGYDYVFAIVPDAVSTYVFSRFWMFLWFVSIVIWGSFSALFTGTAFVDTLIDRYPRLMRFRLCTCTMFCMCCFLINCLILNKHYLSFFYYWFFEGVHIVALLLGMLYLVALYIYTIPKLTTDYLFHYGVPLANVWVVCLKYTSLIIVGCVCALAISITSEPQKIIPFAAQTFTIKLTVWIFALALLIPIPFFIVYYYIKFSRISQVSRYFLHSLPLWGPPTNEEKQARRCFNPQRQLRYKVVIRKCKHNCLLNSSKLQDENGRLTENTRVLLEELERRAKEIIDDDEDLDLDL